MNQLTEEQREKVKQIRGGLARVRRDPSLAEPGYAPPLWEDIAFLLSLLDSPAVNPITYYSEDGNYNPVGKNIANHAATLMRDTCTEEAKNLRDKFQRAADTSVLPNDMTASRDRAVANALTGLMERIESLTLDQVQEKR